MDEVNSSSSSKHGVMAKNLVLNGVLSLVAFAGAFEPTVVQAMIRVKRQGVSVHILFFRLYDMNTCFQGSKV